MKKINLFALFLLISSFHWHCSPQRHFKPDENIPQQEQKGEIHFLQEFHHEEKIAHRKEFTDPEKKMSEPMMEKHTSEIPRNDAGSQEFLAEEKPQPPERQNVVEAQKELSQPHEGPKEASQPHPFNPYTDLDPRKGQVGLKAPQKLKLHRGSFFARKDGQLIENLHIKGTLYIHANKVIVRNCKIEASGDGAAIAFYGTKKKHNGTLIQYSEIFGARIGISMATQKVFSYGGPSANRFEYLYIHHVGDGIQGGNNFTLYRSRIETIDWKNNHSDGVQIFQEGQVKLIDSYIDAGVDTRTSGQINAAVFLGQDFPPPIKNVHVINCYLNGGGHIYRHWTPKKDKLGKLGYARPTGCSVINSWFGPNSLWVPAVAYVGADNSPIWKNNRFIKNKKPVPLERR